MQKVTFLSILLPVVVQAQQIKPRIIFDVDTSGSMAWEACDPSSQSPVDHTTDCPGSDIACIQCAADGCGDTLPNDGRLWKVKNALNQVISAFGEVEFGLARFASTAVPFGCIGGGWSGPSAFCSASPLGMNDNAADILVEFADDNQTDLLEWIDYQSNSATLPPPDTGCSLCADCGGGCDKELRPTGNTPIAGSIVSCNNYLDTVRSTDAQADCRPYGLIVLSDGQNTCNDPFNPGDPDPSPEQAAEVCLDGIPVHVIGFASPTIKLQLDQIAAAGCGPACDDLDNDGVPNCSTEAIIVDNETDLALAFADIIQGSIRIEVCNGEDDDCDGLIDEDFVTLGSPCGKGRCAGSVCCDGPTATKCCALTPSCEVCNRIDDDCDGIQDNNIDEDCNGIVDFPAVTCTCYPEECNGYDDDCDCTADTNMDGTFCGAGDVNVDEEPLITSGYPCGTDQGLCESGLTCCMNSTPTCCGEVGPTSELCDCLDNDCNGATDEGGFTDCFTLGDGCDPGTGVCKGICQLGKSECRDTDPSSMCVAGAGDCLAQRGPETETCNCIDDNCNDLTDEDVLCPGGGRCENCGCPAFCDPLVEFPCPQGFNCECAPTADCDCGEDAATNPDCVDKGTENWFCQVDVCLGITCDPCEYCESTTGGTCISLCGSGQVTCQTWEECRCDQCVDLSCTNPDEKQCGEGETCNPITHECDPDPCVKAGCSGNEYCRTDGECGDDLCVPACPDCTLEEDPHKCVCGVCVPDPCGNTGCSETQTCCSGSCIADPCLALDCDAGQKCNSCTGSCEIDTCEQIKCPEGNSCLDGECLPIGVGRRDKDTTISAAGQGGCACRISGSPDPGVGSWAMLLGLFIVLVWRRSCAK